LNARPTVDGIAIAEVVKFNTAAMNNTIIHTVEIMVYVRGAEELDSVPVTTGFLVLFFKSGTAHIHDEGREVPE
jgi:hypothetical protein